LTLAEILEGGRGGSREEHRKRERTGIEYRIKEGNVI
jgi:hypothetical protein